MFDKGKIEHKSSIIKYNLDYYFYELTILEICAIDENKVAIYYKKNGIITGYNAILSFYNVSNRENHQIKLGDYQNGNNMFLVDDKIILFKNDKFILIDINSRKILNKLKFTMNGFSIILLSSKRFLIQKRNYIGVLEILSDKINLKEEKYDFDFFELIIISKYGGNKLVGKDGSIIAILGCST